MAIGSEAKQSPCPYLFVIDEFKNDQRLKHVLVCIQEFECKTIFASSELPATQESFFCNTSDQKRKSHTFDN